LGGREKMSMEKTFLNSYLYIFVIIFFIVVFSSNSALADQINTAVTIVPQKQFVQAVSGPNNQVVVMIPPGYSPGNYAPKPSELTKLSDSNIYFSIGVPADLQNILPKIKQFNPNIEITKLAELVGEKYEPRTFSNGGTDPHIWLSLKRVSYIIEIIRDKFIKLNPNREEFYRNNTEDYLEKIKKNDQKIREIIDKKENKYMLVYHPSFGYFAEEYGLEMISIEENGKKATAKHLQEIIDFARQNNINRIFYQAEIDSRQTEAVAEEIGAKLVKLDPLAGDYLNNLVEMAEKISGGE